MPAAPRARRAAEEGSGTPLEPLSPAAMPVLATLSYHISTMDRGGGAQRAGEGDGGPAVVELAIDLVEKSEADVVVCVELVHADAGGDRIPSSTDKTLRTVDKGALRQRAYQGGGTAGRDHDAVVRDALLFAQTLKLEALQKFRSQPGFPLGVVLTVPVTTLT